MSAHRVPITGLARGGLLTGAAMLLHACALGGEDIAANDDPVPEIAGTTQPVAYAGSRVELREGARVGDYRYAMLKCYPFDSHAHWGRGPLRDPADSWSEGVREVLGDAGVTLSRDPDALFPTEERSPRYLLGARVTDIEMTLCDRIDWFSGDAEGRQSGSARVTVDWRVHDAWREETVLAHTVEGAASVERGARDGEVLLLDRAMQDAARALLGEAEVRELLTREQERADSADSGRAELAVASPALYEAPLEGEAARVRSGVVTVGGARGHGSGVFITPSLILTNEHVVQASERMPVTVTSGEQLTARVLRREPRRDVALLRVDSDAHTPLPVRAERPRVGATVYAVGTPLDEDLAATVTRGTVSGFRESPEEMSLIQADVDIQGGNSGGPLLDARGNVIALAVSGLPGSRRDSSSIGINFFIPIADALDRLGLRLDRAPTAARAGAR